jgi:hypothetical protein
MHLWVFLFNDHLLRIPKQGIIIFYLIDSYYVFGLKTPCNDKNAYYGTELITPVKSFKIQLQMFVII